MKRILCLRFPAWPLQRLIVARRELRQSLSDRAIIIVKRNARGSEVVYQASALARQQGVRAGMPLAEAMACFPDERTIQLANDDPAIDLLWLTRMATWCERYSPLVGWKTISSLPPSDETPEALFLDIQGIGVLFGGEELLLQDLLHEVQQRGFLPRIGIADTIGAAWAVTQAANVVSIVPAGQSPAAMAALPVSALRLNYDTLDKLRLLGVSTIAQLCELPRRGLSARFGEGLLLRLDQALGNAVEVIEPHRPAPEFFVEWVLEQPTQRREEVDYIFAELVKRLAAQLWQQQRGATQIMARLDAAGRQPACFTVGLYRPSAVAKHLLDLVLLQVERLRLPQAIGRIGLSVPLTSPLKLRQTSLFENDQRDSEDMSLLLDRLSSRLTPQAVLQVRLRSEALPERAVELIPAIEQVRKRRPASNLGSPSLAHRPLILLPQPIELETLAIVPDGPPLRFRYGQQMQTVARHWGPERIETLWWRGQCVRRDYYRVETSSGTRFWLFHDLQQGRWFLHGSFE